MARFPFGLLRKPRAAKTGPLYGEVYPRSVASALDLGFLFLILNGFFKYVTAIMYSQANVAMVGEIKNAKSAGKILQLVWDSDLGPLWLINSFFQIVVIGILYVSVQIIWGTTPGKWLVGLKIVKAGTLAPVSKWQYIVRYLAYIPAVLPLMVGIFWAQFNAERRGWHDMIAGTVVLNTRPRGWYWNHLKTLYRKLRGKSPTVDTPKNID